MVIKRISEICYWMFATSFIWGAVFVLLDALFPGLISDYLNISWLFLLAIALLAVYAALGDFIAKITEKR